MSGQTKTDTFITISTATAIANEESTMFYLATHTIVRDLVMEGMTGFVPHGTDKNIDGATIKGVYLKLDPNSAIQKSRYIQNCSANGGAAVGAYIY